jgi:CRP-like cAMP-binding protein
LPGSGNHLIDVLPDKDRSRLLAVSKPVALVLSAVLCEPGDATAYAYFPTQSFISLVTRIDDHPGMEVGMVGSEGMLGIELALGVMKTPLHAVVQGAGAAWRIDSRHFLRELARSPALQSVLKRYIHVLKMQLATSAACLHYHLIGPRLARWLLMSQDRAHTDSFRVTHEFLAYMLGVRRVGVTMAAGLLQQRGLIAYHRGQLRVLDRSGLESAACSCYATDRLAYAELI